MKKLLLALLACLLLQSDLAAQTSFYQGQTVTIRVGFTAGGAFEVWARIIGQYMGKYVPGNPTFVVQNMTGGGSAIAANYIYSVAKPDGLTLGVVSPGLYIQQLSGQPEIKFDLVQVQLDRLSGEDRSDILYPRGHSLQNFAGPAQCG